MPKNNLKKYKATVDWRGYNGDRVIIPACVRSPSVRGRNFEATIKAVAEKVPHAIVMICDTLDAHNLVGRSQNPKNEAIRLANIWWAEQEPVISKYFNSYEVHRWQDVQSDPSYKERLELVQKLYNMNTEVKAIIDSFAREHNLQKQKRLQNKGLPFNLTDEMQRSATYLIDEIAGDAVYREWFPDIPEAYNGAYFSDPNLFNRINIINSTIDLTIPKTLPVYLNRLPSPTIVEDCRIKSYKNNNNTILPAQLAFNHG